MTIPGGEAEGERASADGTTEASRRTGDAGAAPRDPATPPGWSALSTSAARAEKAEPGGREFSIPPFRKQRTDTPPALPKPSLPGPHSRARTCSLPEAPTLTVRPLRPNLEAPASQLLRLLSGAAALRASRRSSAVPLSSQPGRAKTRPLQSRAVPAVKSAPVRVHRESARDLGFSLVEQALPGM